MKKEILQKILKTDSVSFSYAEIQKMLDEELEKSPEEMDTQLVDLCVDVLSRKNVPEPKQANKHKKISVKKALLVAAVFISVAVLAIPVGANVLKLDDQDTIIRFVDDYILVNLSGGKRYNLSMELNVYELQNAQVPKKFFSDDCLITDIQPTGDNACNFSFELTDTAISGRIAIMTYTQEFNPANNYTNIYADVGIIKQLTVNGLDILIYLDVNENLCVVYNTDSFCCNILFSNATFDEVMEIIENF